MQHLNVNGEPVSCRFERNTSYCSGCRTIDVKPVSCLPRLTYFQETRVHEHLLNKGSPVKIWDALKTDDVKYESLAPGGKLEDGEAWLLG